MSYSPHKRGSQLEHRLQASEEGTLLLLNQLQNMSDRLLSSRQLFSQGFTDSHLTVYITLFDATYCVTYRHGSTRTSGRAVNRNAPLPRQRALKGVRLFWELRVMKRTVQRDFLTQIFFH